VHAAPTRKRKKKEKKKSTSISQNSRLSLSLSVSLSWRPGQGPWLDAIAAVLSRGQCGSIWRSSSRGEATAALHRRRTNAGDDKCDRDDDDDCDRDDVDCCSTSGCPSSPPRCCSHEAHFFLAPPAAPTAPPPPPTSGPRAPNQGAPVPRRALGARLRRRPREEQNVELPAFFDAGRLGRDVALPGRQRLGDRRGLDQAAAPSAFEQQPLPSRLFFFLFGARAAGDRPRGVAGQGRRHRRRRRPGRARSGLEPRQEGDRPELRSRRLLFRRPCFYC